MSSTHLWRSFALGLVVILSCQCANGNSATAGGDKGAPGAGQGEGQDKVTRIFDGNVSFPVRGLEFRNSYAGDKTGPGIVVNAQNDLRVLCQQLGSDLATNIKDKLLDFDCMREKNISTRGDRAQYQADAVVKFGYQHIVRVAYGSPVEGQYAKSGDYNPKSEAREAARKSYDEICESFVNEMKQTYGQYLLVADCGVATEKGQADGWGYSSMPTAYYYSDEAPPASCGEHQDSETWYELDPNDPVTINAECEFGGTRQETYENYKEYRCDNGSVSATGDYKTGDLLGSVGQCSMGRSCGSHSHGTQWWEVDGSNRVGEPESCGNGQTRYRIYEREVLLTCWDGAMEDTGQERRGRFVGYQGDCYQAPRNCGSRYSGESWWEVDYSNTIRDRQSCPFGYDGYVLVTYARTVNYTCYDGWVSRGADSRGTVIRREDYCRRRGGGHNGGHDGWGNNGGGHNGGGHNGGGNGWNNGGGHNGGGGNVGGHTGGGGNGGGHGNNGGGHTGGGNGGGHGNNGGHTGGGNMGGGNGGGHGTNGGGNGNVGGHTGGGGNTGGHTGGGGNNGGHTGGGNNGWNNGGGNTGGGGNNGGGNGNVGGHTGGGGNTGGHTGGGGNNGGGHTGGGNMGGGNGGGHGTNGGGNGNVGGHTGGGGNTGGHTGGGGNNGGHTGGGNNGWNNGGGNTGGGGNNGGHTGGGNMGGHTGGGGNNGGHTGGGNMGGHTGGGGNNGGHTGGGNMGGGNGRNNGGGHGGGNMGGGNGRNNGGGNGGGHMGGGNNGKPPPPANNGGGHNGGGNGRNGGGHMGGGNGGGHGNNGGGHMGGGNGGGNGRNGGGHMGGNNGGGHGGGGGGRNGGGGNGRRPPPKPTPTEIVSPAA